MRCPKCGYISFDHMSSCSKCGRDISELATELQGTSIKADTPTFLGGAIGGFSGQEEDSFDEQVFETEMDV